MQLKKIPIKEIVTYILGRFENAVSISVQVLPQHEDPGMVSFSVHTGEAEFEEYVSLYEHRETHVVIESEDDEQFCLPFHIIATCDGPKYETMVTTPVYATDTIRGTGPISVDDGLDQLRRKIGKSHDDLRELVNGR